MNSTFSKLVWSPKQVRKITAKYKSKRKVGKSYCMSDKSTTTSHVVYKNNKVHKRTLTNFKKGCWDGKSSFKYSWVLNRWKLYMSMISPLIIIFHRNSRSTSIMLTSLIHPSYTKSLSQTQFFFRNSFLFRKLLYLLLLLILLQSMKLEVSIFKNEQTCELVFLV